MLTQLEIMRQIRAAQEREAEDGWTREEYEKEMGLKATAAREHIKRLMNAGDVITCGKRRRVVNGVPIYTPVYKFTQAYARQIAKNCGKEAGKAAVVGAVPPKRKGGD